LVVVARGLYLARHLFTLYRNYKSKIVLHIKTYREKGDCDYSH